jgi:hypothetical protein
MNKKIAFRSLCKLMQLKKDYQERKKPFLNILLKYMELKRKEYLSSLLLGSSNSGTDSETTL